MITNFSRNSLRIRLSTLLAVSVLVIGSLTAVVSNQTLARELRATLRDSAFHELAEFSAAIQGCNTKADFKNVRDKLATIFPEEGTIALQVWSTDLELALHLSDKRPDELPYWPEGLSKAQSGQAVSHILEADNIDSCLAAKPISAGTESRWIISTVVESNRRQTHANQHLTQLFEIVVVVSLISFVVGFILLTLAFRPLQQMIDDIRSIRAEGLERRLATPAEGSEFRQLVNLVNSMLDNIESSFLRLKHFSVHVGHEMKTPITRMQNAAEKLVLEHDSVCSMEQSVEILEEVSQLSQLLDALLDLALAQDKTIKTEKLSQRVLFADLHEQSQMLAQSFGKTISVTMPETDRTVEVNRELISRAFLNLVINALKYSKADSNIDLKIFGDDQKFGFRVENKLATAEELPIEKLLQPFYRHRPNGSKGHGLGLALTATIVEQHGGKLAVVQDSLESVTFSVELPVKSQVESV